MNPKILLFVVLFMIVPITLAFEYPVLYNDTFDNTTLNSNWSLSSCTINRDNSGILNCTNGFAIFVNELVNVSESRNNYTIEFDLSTSSIAAGNEFIFISDKNSTDGSAVNDQHRTGLRVGDGTSIDAVGPAGILKNITAHNSWFNLKVEIYTNNSFLWYRNGTSIIMSTYSAGNFSFILIGNSALSSSILVDNFLVYNGTNKSAHGNLYPSVYDEFLGKPSSVTQNVTLQLISDSYSRNYTMISGAIDILNIPVADYRISYSGSDFPLRDYYLNVNFGSNSADLYLLSSGNSTNVVITVQDENVKEVANATVKLLRYYTSTNSYVPVAMTRTDSNGQGRFNIETYNGFYYFVVEKDGSTVLTTSPARIITTTLTLSARLGADPFQSREAIRDISHTLTFVNSSDQFRFTYNDASGLLREACLVVERRTFGSQEVSNEICNNCSIASSGTILCTVNISNTGTYYAYGQIETNTKSSHYLTNSLAITDRVANLAKDKFGELGIYLTSYIFMALALISIPIPWLSVTLSLIGLIFATIMGIFGLTYLGISTVIILGSLIVFMSRSR